MSDTCPKANTVTIGYDQVEDRIFLIFYLQDGKTRKAYISRRLLGMLLKNMGDKLSTSSATASRTPNPSEVMQMEHIAAVVDRKPGKVPETQTKSKEPASYYATEAQIQAQEDTITLGLKSVNSEPIAGLALPRTVAHQVLRLLSAT